MRREEVAQLLFSPQFAHDLGERQLGKNPLGLQPQRQQIREHFDQQGRIETIPLELHRADMENRFHDLPETLDHMVLFPNMPQFSPPHRRFTKVHQIIATRGRFAKKEQHDRAKGRIVAPSTIGRDINPPFRCLQDELFFQVDASCF